jgi:ATP-dependent DNA helicase RecQ
MADSTAEPEALAHMHEKLDEMWAYCRRTACRHHALVDYFGQSLEQESCNACDFCLDHYKPVTDPLIVGQKILSCVLRLKEGFGAAYVADVLCGSQKKDILERGHHDLSTYGLLQHHPTHVVRDWMEQLITQGFMNRDADVSVLRVTPEGRELLRGTRTPHLVESATPSKIVPSRQNAQADTPEDALFQELRRWRRATADEKNVPPFVVFGDATLLHLAAVRPTTKQALLQVQGIGQRKAGEYGKFLLPLIQRYCEQHALSTNVGVRLIPHVERTVSAGSAPRERKRHHAAEAAFVMFRNGDSPESVANTVGRTVDWGYEKLAEYIRAEGVTDPEPWVDQTVFAKVSDLADTIGADRMKPIYEYFDGTINYDTIRVCLAIHRNR